MPDLNNSKCRGFRVIFNFVLQAIIISTVIITRTGPDIKYRVGFGFGDYTISWEMTRRDFFACALTDFFFHLIFVCVDCMVFKRLFDRPLRRNVRLKAVVINGLRLFVTLLELFILSQNWTEERITAFGILGVNLMLRLFALLLEVVLCTQLGFVLFHLRPFGSVEF